MLALFHDKKFCNCFNLFSCILWDFIVVSLVLSWWRLNLKRRISGFHEKQTHERAMWEAHAGSWRVMPGCRFREYLADKAFSQGSRKTFCLEDFFSMTFLPFTLIIYTFITFKCEGGHSERKTLDRFSITHTPIFLRESYSSLVRNHSGLFFFPFPLSYIEKRFVPKHNLHLFRV